jgi:hypothetical protein
VENKVKALELLIFLFPSLLSGIQKRPSSPTTPKYSAIEGLKI